MLGTRPEHRSIDAQYLKARRSSYKITNGGNCQTQFENKAKHQNSNEASDTKPSQPLQTIPVPLGKGSSIQPKN